MNSWNQDEFKRALDFAARAHGEQKVPGSGFPYVVHLTKVATEVMRACVAEPGLDATYAMTCALLHDSIEDASVTRSQIAEAFGEDVATGVVALSKDDAVEKSQRMADSLRRIKAARQEIAAVKLADRITNLEPPPAHWPSDKRARYLEEAKLIRATLGGASRFLAARIDEKIAAYAAYV